MKTLSLVIPHLNECLLQHTIRSAQNNAAYPDELEITPLEDLKQEGVDVLRDRGLLASQTDLVCISDAHCTFAPKWDKAVRDTHTDPTAFACVQCVRLSADCMVMFPGYKRHYGAHVTENGANHWGITAVWNVYPTTPTSPVIEVPCPLGGFYVLSRQHYVETLSRPWQHLKNYGKSEELISLLNFKLGFPNLCYTQIAVGHCFRSYPPYTQVCHKLRHNKILLALTAADTEAEEHRLLTAMNMQHTNLAREMKTVGPCLEELKATIAKGQRRTYAEWCKWNADVAANGTTNGPMGTDRTDGRR